MVACGGSGDSTTVPGAPTIGNATAGDASVSIAFTAPASDGGATITAYTGTCTAGTRIDDGHGHRQPGRGDGPEQRHAPTAAR